MANPSPAAVDAIRAALAGGWSATDADLATALNTTMVDNPVPQPTVPKPFGTATMVGVIAPENLAKLLTLPSFEATIRPMLDQPDPKGAATLQSLNLWAAGLFKAGMLSRAEFDALAAPTPGTTADAPVGVFNQTQPDPSWPAQIGWGVATLGRPVDADDIRASRP